MSAINPNDRQLPDRSRPVVLVPEPIGIRGWTYDIERSILDPYGVQLLIAGSRDEAEKVMPFTAVVMTSSPITSDDIARLENCVGILCYSVGMDHVDVRSATSRGIRVVNCPTHNNEEVSDHAVALILAAERRLLTFALAAREGDWDVYNSPEIYEIHRIASRTVGIIGLGRIGCLVAQKLHGFRPTVIAYDPYVRGYQDASVQLVPLDELCARADIIVSCAALTETSRGLIDSRLIAQMKPGVILVNVSRGGIIVEDDLADALTSGHVAYAALDVRSQEPPSPATDRITGLPNVLLTQHLAASSMESLQALHVEAAEQIIRLLREGGRLETAPP